MFLFIWFVEVVLNRFICVFLTYFFIWFRHMKIMDNVDFNGIHKCRQLQQTVVDFTIFHIIKQIIKKKHFINSLNTTRSRRIVLVLHWLSLPSISPYLPLLAPSLSLPLLLQYLCFLFHTNRLILPIHPFRRFFSPFSTFSFAPPFSFSSIPTAL